VDCLVAARRSTNSNHHLTRSTSFLASPFPPFQVRPRQPGRFPRRSLQAADTGGVTGVDARVQFWVESAIHAYTNACDNPFHSAQQVCQVNDEMVTAQRCSGLFRNRDHHRHSSDSAERLKGTFQSAGVTVSQGAH
jgi:hypothetical protein